MDFTPGGQFTARKVTLGEFLPLIFRTRPGAIDGAPSWFDSTRFDLVAKAPKSRDGYSLVAARSGSKLIPSATPGPPLCKRGLDSADCTNLTARDLAEHLPLWVPGEVDRTVIDMTNLPGTFDFTLEWVAARRAEAEGGLSLFDALTKQLGLRLEPRKLPLPVVVIDSAEQAAEQPAEQPSAN